jgi:nucleoside-diphosphate-sugar epimerase
MDPMPPAARIAITGAGGLIGRLIAADLAADHLVRALAHEDADVTDLDALTDAFAGCDAVVHLAAASHVNAPWEVVLPDNLVGARHVFEAAYRAGVGRVVFASSNHAVGMYEWDAARFVDPDHPIEVTVDVAARPDSLYGASKVWGEAVGRYYVERRGLSVVCLRIGWVTDDDRPPAIPAGADEDDRLIAVRGVGMWLSHRDCTSLVRAALAAEVDFAVVHGVSDNVGRWLSLGEARDRLGWVPRDGARRGVASRGTR